MIRTYSELKSFDSFEDRFNYLSLKGSIGVDTFGFDRYLNQIFYRSKEWLNIRDYVITRDNGLDLGVADREIFGKIIIHHMNPVTKEDLINNPTILLDPEFLISTSMNTHNAIHYGDIELVDRKIVTRSKNDTCPWKH